MGPSQEKTFKIKVKFTQQQLELLEKLRREGTFGNTYEEIVVNIFRDYIKQESPKGGAK